MLKRTRRVAAATIVLPLALLTACSSDTPAPTANPTAAGTIAGSTTTPATSTAAPTHGDRDSFVAALLAGSTKMTTAHVEMAMEIEGQAVTMSGDMKMAGASPAMQMTMDMGEAMSLDMILLESSLFLKGIPGLEPGKWAKVAVTGAMAEEFEKSLQQADPAQLAATYEKAVKDVKFVGAEEVDGEPVQHYEVTMDTKALGDTLPQDAKDLPDTVVYDMWLDADNRLRQVVYSVAGAEVEMKMSNYGEPVDISAPPAADVVEVPNS
ncbi:LppX_LprAFG lipoprotein [Intrasporangium calvum]|uniref:LppX_LprAFG lipoprotein n=1 Tax=Intrasporangium calvum TaxID=53358 RepID=A0ABT5GH01_9MICO|nr:LppX_LprAFG lipoprotein [Intrasporangium calvum]MDC5697489.1 LppX_LprAFG lipoprotein [Intrasporangium calvum]